MCKCSNVLSRAVLIGQNFDYTTLMARVREHGLRELLPGDDSECDPPDPISTSIVKPFSADDSVALAM